MRKTGKKLSSIAEIMILRVNEMKEKINKNEIMIVSFVVFMLGIYAPYEVYITNPGEFWFSCITLLEYCIAVSLCCLAFGVLFLSLIKGKIKAVISILLFWMGVCTYLQGSFLNADIGQLTGISFVSDKYISYYIRDGIVWGIVLCILLLIYKKNKGLYEKLTVYLPAFIMAVLLITGIALFAGAYQKEKRKDNVTEFNSVYGLTTLGNEENIIVFVLDMFDSTYLDEIVDKQPEVMDSFDGFVRYDNYVGGYATTAYSLAYMNSGKYFRNEMILDDFVNSQDSYVDELLENEYDVANYGAYGFPGRLYGKFSNYIEGKVKVRNPFKFILHIYEMGAFRYAPNIFKVALVNFHDKFPSDVKVDADYKQYSDSNADIADFFKDMPIEIEDGKFFKMIYAKGVHYPYENDENLNRVKANEEHPVECAVGALKMVEKYLDSMKESGVYDNTTVIITADHGFFSDYGQETISRPIMLIKQKNSHGNLQVNSSPVSHEDFPATIISAATGDNVNDFGNSIFSYNENDERTRFYYHYYLKEKGDSRRLIEYKVANDSKLKSAFEITGNEYTVDGNIINHVRYCETCQTGNHFGKGECWHEKTKDYPE